MKKILLALALSCAVISPAVGADDLPTPPNTLSRDTCTAISQAHWNVTILLVGLSTCRSSGCEARRAQYQSIKEQLMARFSSGNCRYWTEHPI